MNWILQEMLSKEENVKRVERVLQSTKTKYRLVKIEKDGQLTMLDKKTRLPVKNTKENLDKFVQGEKIMVYGSKKLSEIAKARNWTPGTFEGENFDYKKIQEQVGDYLLNKRVETGELWELDPKQEEFFIRPEGNTKLFNGSLITRKEFLRLQKEEVRGESEYTNQKLVLAPKKEIKNEYRFFVVDGEIISGSTYPEATRVEIDRYDNSKLAKSVKMFVKMYQPAQAFVIDIAKTGVGYDNYEIVEYNNINTSGLYASDERKIIKALNKI